MAWRLHTGLLDTLSRDMWAKCLKSLGIPTCPMWCMSQVYSDTLNDVQLLELLLENCKK